jgi:hypothetical protein
MSRFLGKQLDHLESLKLGRTENYYEAKEVDGNVTFDRKQRRTDAAKLPQMVTQEEFPVGKKRHVVKPGSE